MRNILAPFGILADAHRIQAAGIDVVVEVAPQLARLEVAHDRIRLGIEGFSPSRPNTAEANVNPLASRGFIDRLQLDSPAVVATH